MVSDATIHIILILIVMAGWWAELLDVKGAFLHGVFEKGRKVYMEVPPSASRRTCVSRAILPVPPHNHEPCSDESG